MHTGILDFPLWDRFAWERFCKEAGHEVLILRDSVRSVYDARKGWLHDALTRADVVAISMMTYGANRAYQIADIIREVAL